MRAGDLIKTIRELTGLNQTMLGTVLGVSQTQIGRYERYIHDVPKTVIDRLFEFSEQLYKTMPAQQQLEIKNAWDRYSHASSMAKKTDADNIVAFGAVFGVFLAMLDWLNADD